MFKFHESRIGRAIGNGQVSAGSSVLAKASAMVFFALVWLAMLLAGPSSLGIQVPGLAHLTPDSPLTSVAIFLTELEYFLLPIGLVLALWLVGRQRRLDAVVLTISMFVERWVVDLQKIEFRRPRPDPHFWLTHANGLAFPSGHAANSMLICSLSAFLIAPVEWRKAAVGAGITLSLLIGVSRILLRVHWPSDVIAGWAFGLFWMLGSVTLLDYLHAIPSRVSGNA